MSVRCAVGSPENEKYHAENCYYFHFNVGIYTLPYNSIRSHVPMMMMARHIAEDKKYFFEIFLRN